MDSGYAEMIHQVDVLEYRINQYYRQAERELQEKIEKYYKDFDRLDQKKRELVNSGKLSEADYKTWRHNKIMTGKVWEQRKDVISRDLYNTNYKARNMVYDELPDIYASAHNFATYQIENGAHVDTSYTLYNKEAVERLIADDPDLLPYQKLNMAKDVSWNKRNLQGVMIQGILQGESIPHLAKRLSKTVVQKNRAYAIRNARTMATAAYNGGKMDAFKRAKALGIDMKVRWRATFDDRTRDSHRRLDGEVVEVGQPFSNGLTFPCDMSWLNGAGYGLNAKVVDVFKEKCAETYNCRCTIQGVVKGLEPRAIKYRSNKAVGIPYEEWKKGHKAANEYRKANGMLEHDRKGKETIPKKPKTPAPIKTLDNKAYEDKLRRKIVDTYNSHIDANKLVLLKQDINELNVKDLSGFNAQWAKMDNGTVKDFTNQLCKLMDEYDTPLNNVILFDKMDYLGRQNVFAYVYHDYRMDSAEMRINPVKCSSEKMLGRLRELREMHYTPNFRDGAENVYIVTHEFAHSMLELEAKFEKNKNWAGADYKRLQNIRNDVLNVYKDYMEDVRNASAIADAAELDALTAFDSEAWEKAAKLREKYLKTQISRYSLENANEFMAEAFADAMLSDNPNPYSLKVKKILDDNFKRKK